jgi:hypothetical protein
MGFRNMSTSLQTEFAAFMHLAEGQILCVTENMGICLTLQAGTCSPILSDGIDNFLSQCKYWKRTPERCEALDAEVSHHN